jgi:microcystin-dependent protein
MTIPVGAIIPYGGDSAPSGYLLCYGQAVSRTTYADLFTVTGTTYGSGDGSTTFNVPDLRGRVIAGQDDMGGASANRLTGQSGGVNGDILGAAGGAETHTLIISEMPAHTHLNGHPEFFSATTFYGTDDTGLSNEPSVAAESANQTSDSPITSTTGGGGAHNNVQPTFILNYIIHFGEEPDFYVTEDGTDNYVAENGTDNYITEI